MQNQRRDSRTDRVRQNAHRFLDSDTIHPSPTPEQVTPTTHFLAMGRAAMRGEAVNVTSSRPKPDKGFQRQSWAAPVTTPSMLTPDQGEDRVATLPEIVERRIKSKAHHRAARKVTQPTVEAIEGEDSPNGPALWLLDALQFCEQQDAQVQTERARVFVTQKVQRQPLPRLSELLDLELFRPKRGKGFGTAGAGALAVRLYELARVFLAARLYLYDKDGHPPKQVVMHLCAELLAESLGICDNTMREWTAQLTAKGFVYARHHYTSMTGKDGQRMTAVDGTLYAVSLAPGHTARLRYRDYKRQYRDLDADKAAGRTAYNAILNAEKRFQEAQILECVQDDQFFIEGSSNPTGQMQAELLEQLKRWAVIPGNIDTQNPLKHDPAINDAAEAERLLNGVQDVVFLLPTLLEAHKSKRAALVGMMGAALARDLKDSHSRLYYCKVIWSAWQAEIEGRDGLQALAAELQRLEVDRREWKGLRRPAALLAARLRAA
ncbi:Replication protein [Deinococcus saxicola]